MRWLLSVILACTLLAPTHVCAQSFPVSVTVDASRVGPPVPQIARFFGADEPNYATMRDGRALLAELGALAPGNVYFRTHNLLNTGEGAPSLKWGSTNAYTEDAQGRPIYDWTILDRIFDAYISAHVRPYVEIGFMPEALSTSPAPYQSPWRPGFHYDRTVAGWQFPPKDYAKWRELVFQWVQHCVQRYGRAEVEQWYFEVWNEPNLPFYWRGSAEEFYRLHDFAIDGVRRALPTARVGGPDVAGSGGDFMRGFLDHVTTGVNYATGRAGTPMDFVSFHAKGAPQVVDGHVRMGIAAQMHTIDEGFALIGERPALRNLPIIIGEADPDSCAACLAPQYAYRNGAAYASFTAASFARILDIAALRHVNAGGALTWAFEFEDKPYFAGYRQLASNGVDLPVLNVFRLFAMMDGRRVAAVSSAQTPLATVIANGVRSDPDIGVLSSLSPTRLSVLIWHYHDDVIAGPDAHVRLHIRALPGALASGVLSHYRIDDGHSNAFEAWRAMGAPEFPDETQYAALKAAGQLALLEPPRTIRARRGGVELEFDLPRQGVSLITIERGAANE